MQRHGVALADFPQQRGCSLLNKERAMREIIRQDVLWREVIPLATFAVIVAIVFMLAIFSGAEDLADADYAMSWTVRLVGALVAVVATFGLFWRAMNGAPLELQFGFVLALLAGLLLLGIHWSLAIALGVIGVALIVREVYSRYYVGTRRTDGDYAPPMDRPMT
jgi:hypothetical protein